MDIKQDKFYSLNIRAMSITDVVKQGEVNVQCTVSTS